LLALDLTLRYALDLHGPITRDLGSAIQPLPNQALGYAQGLGERFLGDFVFSEVPM
jgi:hypothetical protein